MYDSSASGYSKYKALNRVRPNKGTCSISNYNNDMYQYHMPL